MRYLPLAALFLLGAGLTVYAWWRREARHRAVERLRSNDAQEEIRILRRQTPLIRRYLWSAVLVALAVAVALLWGLGWPWSYSLALAMISGLLAWQVDGLIYAGRLLRLEQQLADAIDLMVAAVKSGSTLQGAIESAAAESKQPLRAQLEEILGRIRLGDVPSEVFLDFADRTSLETFRIYSLTLAVNWEVGGRLSQTLANVGRTIRDRIEMTRRINAVTLQSRLSIGSILVVTYFIAALMWRNDPQRMVGFVNSIIGQSLVCTAMVLQGVGIIWISRLSRPKF